MNVISMGDKNNIREAAGADVAVKTGHGIIKAIYATQGDRTWIIRDGTDATGELVATIATTITSTVSMPYVNHPVNTGIFIDNTVAGTVGTIQVIYE